MTAEELPSKLLICLFVFFLICTGLDILNGPELEGKRVYVIMIGDPFDSEHVEFLRKAKELGTYLIVGVPGHEATKSSYRKPIMSIEERIKVIFACKYVDEVIANCPRDLTQELIDKCNIHLVQHEDGSIQKVMKKRYGKYSRRDYIGGRTFQRLLKENSPATMMNQIIGRNAPNR